MEEKSNLICLKCQVEMKNTELQFEYLGKSFRHKVDRCPVCGQVYLREELVKGRISEVEKMLEDK